MGWTLLGGRIRGCEERRDAYVSATGDKGAGTPNGCPSVYSRLKEQVKWPQLVRVLVSQRRPLGDKVGPVPFSDGYRGGRSCTRWGKKERFVRSSRFITPGPS